MQCNVVWDCSSLLLELLGHFGHFGRTCRFGHFWPAISEPGRARQKKVPLGVLLRQTRPSRGRVWSKINPPEARQNISTGGALPRRRAGALAPARLLAWGSTPPAEMWVFGNSFRSALFTSKQRRVCLLTNITKPPPAGFAGAVRRSRAITQKHAFLCVFLRAAKIVV